MCQLVLLALLEAARKCFSVDSPQDSRADKQAFRESLWLPLQVSPDKYKSIGNGFRVTVREDGMRGLAKGWAPTFIGYSMQGLCKFGFYEVFKIFYSDMLGEVRPAATRRRSRLLWLTSVVFLFFFSFSCTIG